MAEGELVSQGTGGVLVHLDDAAVSTLEAFADTVLPGKKRQSDDVAIAGVSDTPGCVEAGALHVLTDPATGIEDGVAEMATALNHAAVAFAQEHGLLVHPDLPFVSLRYEERRTLVAQLTGESQERDLWFLLALFSYMAYDSAPHEDTVELLTDPQRWSGLREMGFVQKGPRMRFEPSSYGRALARTHSETDSRGNLP